MSTYKHTLSVTAVVECGGKFLFVKRPQTLGNFPDKWVFPGGKVEAGEDVIQALLRELVEETGLEFHNELAFLSAYQFTREEDHSSTQGLVFLVRSRDMHVHPDSESIAQFRWITPEDIIDYRNNTIYGMEVHVRNALIILRRKMLLDWHLLSVTTYQTNQGQMDKDYFRGLIEAADIDEFLRGRDPLPHYQGKDQTESDGRRLISTTSPENGDIKWERI